MFGHSGLKLCRRPWKGAGPAPHTNRGPPTKPFQCYFSLMIIIIIIVYCTKSNIQNNKTNEI